MKKWITFDLDGTLMQNPFKHWVFPEIDEAVAKIRPECKAVQEMVLENERRMDNHLYPSAYDWDDILNQFLKKHGIELSLNIEELVKKHSQIPKVFLLEDGIPDVLKELKARGFSLAVITNGFYKYQYPVMESLGLACLFDEINTPDRVLCAKPDINMGKVLTETGTIAAHVGDRVDHDVVFANHLGAKSILIDRHLPEDIAALPPVIRPMMLKEEWDGSKNGPPKLSMPDIVITSIKELLLLNL
jgi:FMN phosphatase YigB (HAD superfamily)